MSLNFQNKRYKEETISSEISPEVTLEKQICMQSCFLSQSRQLEVLSKKDFESFFSHESEIVEFQFNRDEPDGTVNLASFEPPEDTTEKEQDNKNLTLEKEAVTCKLWCLNLNATDLQEICKMF
jgi:hypothetical protein